MRIVNLIENTEGKSGCAHNGILSILDAYKEKYESFPDVVISGFHLMLKREYRENELEEVRDIAKELKRYPTKFFTCHCTGEAAFEEMKKIMGDQLEYVSSGETVMISNMLIRAPNEGALFNCKKSI